MTLQAHHRPARDGLAWIRDGAVLFRKQPFALMALVMLYLLVLLVITRLPYLGLVASALLFPGLSMSFLYACRRIGERKLVTPALLVEAYRADRGSAARPLLVLGALVLAASAIALLPVFALQASPAVTERDMMRNTIAVAAAQIPISLGFWFAPVLVAWHRVPPVKALFFSIVAVWRNLAAFVVMGLALGALLCTFAFAAFIAASAAGGSQALLAILAVPLSVAFTALLQCAGYASYIAVFASEPPAA